MGRATCGSVHLGIVEEGVVGQSQVELALILIDVLVGFFVLDTRADCVAEGVQEGGHFGRSFDLHGGV